MLTFEFLTLLIRLGKYCICSQLVRLRAGGLSETIGFLVSFLYDLSYG